MKLHRKQNDRVSELLNELLIWTRCGDIAGARFIHTQWYLGGMTEPTIGTTASDKAILKRIATGIMDALNLSRGFTGAVDFNVNRGYLRDYSALASGKVTA